MRNLFKVGLCFERETRRRDIFNLRAKFASRSSAKNNLFASLNSFAQFPSSAVGDVYLRVSHFLSVSTEVLCLFALPQKVL